MQPERIHINVDLPRDLYCGASKPLWRRLHSKGPKKRLSLDEPLAAPTGKPINPADEQIYGRIAFRYGKMAVLISRDVNV